jgi:hypothetical protein
MAAWSAAQRSETTSPFDTVQRRDGWKMVEQPSTWPPRGEWSRQADRIWTTLLLWETRVARLRCRPCQERA